MRGTKCKLLGFPREFPLDTISGLSGEWTLPQFGIGSCLWAGAVFFLFCESRERVAKGGRALGGVFDVVRADDRSWLALGWPAFGANIRRFCEVGVLPGGSWLATTH
jgi:hypothetical protein